jgi:hypothetical protein
VDTFPPTLLNQTNAPTNSSNSSSGVRFAVQYVAVESEPSPEQFERAQQVTLDYLEEFLVQSFELNPLTNMESFEGISIETQSNPVEISYSVDISFTADSTVVPTDADNAVLIESAFLPPAVQSLIELLQGIDATNPFSNTSSVIYDNLERRAVTTKSLQPSLLSTQFSVEYDFVDVAVTDEDLEEIQDTTLEYVQAFLTHKFMLDYNASVVGVRWQSTRGAASTLEFSNNITVIFSEATEVLPTIAELDLLLKEAFQKPYIQALLLELQKLPSVNSIDSKSEVSPVSLGIQEKSNGIRSSSSTRRFTIILGVAFAVGALVILFTRAKRRRGQTECDYSDSTFVVQTRFTSR